MSFFSKLFKKCKKAKNGPQIISQEKISSVESNSYNEDNDCTDNVTNETSLQGEKSSSFANNFNRDNDYFAGIINKDSFPEYSIEQNVHPSVFDKNAHPKCFTITFLIKQDDRPVLAILIMQCNQMKAMIARGTYSILDNKGIPYIRFYREMLNERNYVFNRVKEHLNLLTK